MKCPRCGHNHPAKQGLTCSKCHYGFTFSPKDSNTAGLTDGKFEAAIKRASQNGTALFTDNQLYAAYASKMRPVRLPLIVLTIGLAMFGFIFRNEGIFVASVFFVLALFALLATLFGKSRVLPRNKFRTATEKWLRHDKPIPGLIREPTLHTPPESWQEPDIYDYGVERILLVQRDLLVDLFVKNNQHAEQRMVVIAESGYPEYLIPRVIHLLDQRDDLPIYLLHDADSDGIGMTHRLRSLDWLNLGSHPVIDLGFFPTDFEKLKRTHNFDNRRSERSLPADALLLGPLVTGIGACFASQSTFADELLREQQNQMSFESSFG